MGIYLDSKKKYTLYKNEFQKPYFIDKTKILEELFPLMTGGNYICITRPRRFGKTIMANMIGAYFGIGEQSADIFDKLYISGNKEYERYRNKSHVVSIDFSKTSESVHDYASYMNRIKQQLGMDLKIAYQEISFLDDDNIAGMFDQIYEQTGDRFIFLLDEWDAIFHMDFMKEEDKMKYLFFLRNLLKDSAYVLFVYMTGILPIKKYSSGSELNMFSEYTMASEEKFSDYFGFTDLEVDELYERYKRNCPDEAKRKVTREGLRLWYNGYHAKSGERLYNPRSVVLALTNNNLASYWTSAGPYDEIFYYIKNDIAGIQRDLALMIAGEKVPVKIQEYSAVESSLNTREEIYSAMVVYGFLSYEGGRVTIPNKELMDKFADMIRKQSSLGYIYTLAKKSEEMLLATKAGDIAAMENILSYVHNTESPIYTYNHETELSSVVTLCYLAARDFYQMEREDKAGKGFVDFIFYPMIDKNDTAIILELKVDDTPEEAIRQIKDKQYALRFAGKIGQKPIYTGDILAVGIGYNKDDKKHRCLVEKL